ncbi:sulfite exporter TauE/SafE family protein, partial [Candidatus Parcubacteria bacterium]
MFEYLGFLVLGTLVFAAFFLGVLTGGIGLVVRPLLILWGVPPQVAIGSTRIASLGTRWVGLGELERHKKVNWKRGLLFFAPASAGGFFGAYVTGILDDEVLKIFIAVTLVAAAFLFARQKNLGTKPSTHVPTLFRKALGFVLIVFATALGSITGGAGMLVSYALIACYGETYITAAATRKVMGMGAGMA